MGNKSSLGKREGDYDLDFCDKKSSSSQQERDEYDEDDDDDQQVVQKLDPILSSLNYDVISEVISFLDVKNQLLVCSSSKALFSEFIGTESYNKHFYLCATKHAIPLIHDVSLLDHLFKRAKSEFKSSLNTEQLIVKFNRMWRKLLSVLMETQSFKFNPKLPNIICEEGDHSLIYQGQTLGNFTFSMDSPSNIDLYDNLQTFSSEEKHFLLNFEIVTKDPTRNICIGLGDKEVKDLNCSGRFLGFPDNSLSYSSDGSIRFKIVESIRYEITLAPYTKGDIISMHIKSKPYTKGKEVFYAYQVNFFHNGHHLPYITEDENQKPFPQFDCLCPLYPSFTLHTPGDSIRMIFSRETQSSTNQEQRHKVLERIFAFLLKENLLT